MLALEYVDGDTLAAIVARHVARARLAGPSGLPGMPLLRAWYYFQQLLGALAATHALGIVHRDVKPSNVLVRRDGLVKLGDFGVVRFAGAPASAATQEHAPGTAEYMSPEQVQSGPLDARADLYAAAIVLYEMLAGRTPFPGGGGRPEFLVRKDQVDARPPPVRAFLPQAPPIVDALFARALAKQPADRFESAIEMGGAFRSALGLPDTPEWRAQADIASAARTIVDTLGPDAPDAAAARAVRTRLEHADGPRGTQPLAQAADARQKEQQEKIATLREFVVHRYKTMKLTAI